MRRYTVDDIMAADPCEEYPRSRVEELWSGRDGLTAQEIAALNIPIEDRMWGIIAVCLDDRTRRLFACDCAERALTRERDAGREPDPRSFAAVEVARRYAAGDATLEELTAARIAARTAASYVAWQAEWFPSKYPAWASAESAAWTSPRSSAWEAAKYAAMSVALETELYCQLASAVELAS